MLLPALLGVRARGEGRMDEALRTVKVAHGRKGDRSSPLHLIREKEMEIAGRVLAAKKEAEDVISDARKKAASIVSEASDEGQKLVEKRERKLLGETDRRIEELQAEAERDKQALLATIAEKHTEAVRSLMDLIRS